MRGKFAHLSAVLVGLFVLLASLLYIAGSAAAQSDVAGSASGQVSVHGAEQDPMRPRPRTNTPTRTATRTPTRTPTSVPPASSMIRSSCVAIAVKLHPWSIRSASAM